MLKRPSCKFFQYRGEEYENNLININLVTEVYRTYQKYEFKGEECKIYRIVFLMANGEEATWNFNNEESRDSQYYDL